MKKSLIATFVAAAMLSPVAFAAEPMELSTAQMDSVTAGFINVNASPIVQTATLTQVPIAINGLFGGAAVATATGAIVQTAGYNVTQF